MKAVKLGRFAANDEGPGIWRARLGIYIIAALTLVAFVATMLYVL